MSRFASQLPRLAGCALCARTSQGRNDHVMTRLDTLSALAQERKAVIHSGAGLVWDDLALRMIYI